MSATERTECKRCHKRFDLAETYGVDDGSVCMDCCQDEFDEVLAELAALRARAEALEEAYREEKAMGDLLTAQLRDALAETKKLSPPEGSPPFSLD